MKGIHNINIPQESKDKGFASVPKQSTDCTTSPSFASESQPKIIEVEVNEEALMRREAEKKSPYFLAQRSVAKYLLYKVGNMYLPGEATRKDGGVEVAVCYDFGAQTGKKQVGRITVDANTYEPIIEQSDTATEIWNKRREHHTESTP